jgi:hypothetical protein
MRNLKKDFENKNSMTDFKNELLWPSFKISIWGTGILVLIAFLKHAIWWSVGFLCGSIFALAFFFYGEKLIGKLFKEKYQLKKIWIYYLVHWIIIFLILIMLVHLSWQCLIAALITYTWSIGVFIFGAFQKFKIHKLKNEMKA